MKEQNWRKLVRDFDREDENARAETRKQATSTARDLLWARATAPKGETQTAPTAEECQQAMDAIVGKEGALTAADLDMAWHSKRFRFRPMDGMNVSPNNTHAQMAEKERSEYNTFVLQYGDEEAEKNLPFVLKWKQKVFETDGSCDALMTFTPEMLADPEIALQEVKKIDRTKHAVKRQWFLDIVARALQGRFIKEQTNRIYHDLSLNFDMYRKSLHMIPPCLIGVKSEEEFIKRFARTEK